MTFTGNVFKNSLSDVVNATDGSTQTTLFIREALPRHAESVEDKLTHRFIIIQHTAERKKHNMKTTHPH